MNLPKDYKKCKVCLNVYPSKFYSKKEYTTYCPNCLFDSIQMRLHHAKDNKAINRFQEQLQKVQDLKTELAAFKEDWVPPAETADYATAKVNSPPTSTFRDKNKHCIYCLEKGESIDHLVPKSAGGPDHPSNYVHSCIYCNQLKGDMSLQDFLEFRMRFPLEAWRLFKLFNLSRNDILVHSEKILLKDYSLSQIADSTMNIVQNTVKEALRKIEEVLPAALKNYMADTNLSNQQDKPLETAETNEQISLQIEQNQLTFSHNPSLESSDENENATCSHCSNETRWEYGELAENFGLPAKFNSLCYACAISQANKKIATLKNHSVIKRYIDFVDELQKAKLFDHAHLLLHS